MTNIKEHLIRFLTLAASAILVISFSPPVAHAAGETLNVWTDSGNDDEPLLKAVAEAFEKANPGVSIGKRIYGSPFGSAMGGGILYNKSAYKKLGLKIPRLPNWQRVLNI